MIRELFADLEPYPRWINDALDRIVSKRDDEPLTNTETEAFLRYEFGDEWFESET